MGSKRVADAQSTASVPQTVSLKAVLTPAAKKRITEFLDSFESLPRALVQARIAAGLSQKELAQRLGLKEQQIQRYEATGYASASLTKITEVIEALDIKIACEMTYSEET